MADRITRDDNTFMLIHWIDENSYSVEPRSSLIDTSMINNPGKSGLVKHTNCAPPNTAPPKAGYKTYAAKVISTNGMYNCISNYYEFLIF